MLVWVSDLRCKVETLELLQAGHEEDRGCCLWSTQLVPWKVVPLSLSVCFVPSGRSCSLATKLGPTHPIQSEQESFLDITVTLWLVASPNRFQELDLSKEAFFFHDTPKEEEWFKAVSEGLYPGTKYAKVREESGTFRFSVAMQGNTRRTFHFHDLYQKPVLMILQFSFCLWVGERQVLALVGC